MRDGMRKIIGENHQEQGEKKRQDDHSMNGGESCHHRNGCSKEMNSRINVICKIPRCQDLFSSCDMGKGIGDRIDIISPHKLEGKEHGIEDEEENPAKKPPPYGIGCNSMDDQPYGDHDYQKEKHPYCEGKSPEDGNLISLGG
jgi:hypothetical protein